MKKSTRRRGRPNEIREPTVIATFNITVKQKGWVELMVDLEGLPSASDFMRDLIVEGMLKRGVDPKDPPQE